MSISDVFLMALIQGVTEFLPVSSSAHLVLFSEMAANAQSSLAFDVAVHLGTLGAVIVYFYQDVGKILKEVPNILRLKLMSPNAQRGVYLILATLPAIGLGLIFVLSGWHELLRSNIVIGWTMIGFGLVLYVADKWGKDIYQSENWTLKHAIFMGLAQAIALIPGTSRSGITISAARALGYARHDAAKLSLLMSIPVILASGVMVSIDAYPQMNADMVQTLLLGMFLAFIFAFASIWLMLRLLARISFTPYVIYRIILGFILLAIAYG